MRPTKLLVLVALCVTLSTFQAAPIGTPSNSGPSLNNWDICETTQCSYTAATILKDMDPTTDPCKDFHQFTCGGYYEKRQLPTSFGSISPAKTLEEINDLLLRSIVDASLDRIPKADLGDVASQNNINRIKDYFSSCMDEAAILEAGRKPLVDEIQRIKVFLSTSDSPPDKSSLSKTIARVTKYKFDYPGFIHLHVDPHPTKHSENILTVDENGLGLREVEDYKDDGQLQKYIDATATMFQIILGYEDVVAGGQPLTPQDVGQGWIDIAKEVVDFEVQLAGIRTPWADLLDQTKTNNPRTIDEMSVLTPSSIDWSLLLKETLPAGLDASSPLIVGSPTYLTKLDVLLQQTPAKTQQHYFSWILIRNLVKHLSEPYKKYLADFNFIASTVLPGGTNRKSTCLESVNTNLGHIITHYFVEKTFGIQNRDQIVAIIDSIINGYEYNFRNTDWLDQKTLEGAIKKLKDIVKSVGYLIDNPNEGSSTSLDEYYRDFSVVAGDHFGNQVRYSIWSAAKTFSWLALPRVRGSTMDGPPQEVNAYYKAGENSISIMAGMLHMQYFHAENPEYVNYGAVGTIGGHEIGHAFDSIGRRSDSIGSSTNWWTAATDQAFNEKTQCLVKQYGEFIVRGPDNVDLHVNGENTLPENIADNAGVKMAFRVWNNRFQGDQNGRKYKNFLLPGLEEYTRAQLFFITYGRLWCAYDTPAYAIQVTIPDVHSPGKWRINGVAMNSVDFSTVFNCPAGGPMNPEKKCEVW